ncbi:MAG: zinc finger domain-containing protein [Rhodococcus sp. (in: high G+C Gram-positive bacteria)]
MGLQRTCSTCSAKPGTPCTMRRRHDVPMHIPRQSAGVDSFNHWRYGPNGPS